jgi:hypothetical protein
MVYRPATHACSVTGVWMLVDTRTSGGGNRAGRGVVLRRRARPGAWRWDVDAVLL